MNKHLKNILRLVAVAELSTLLGTILAGYVWHAQGVLSYDEFTHDAVSNGIILMIMGFFPILTSSAILEGICGHVESKWKRFILALTIGGFFSLAGIMVYPIALFTLFVTTLYFTIALEDK